MNQPTYLGKFLTSVTWWNDGICLYGNMINSAAIIDIPFSSSKIIKEIRSSSVREAK